MPIIHVDGKEIYVDFAEYKRSPETFADLEYQKWLAEREVQKQAADDKLKEGNIVSYE